MARARKDALPATLTRVELRLITDALLKNYRGLPDIPVREHIGELHDKLSAVQKESSSWELILSEPS